MKINVAALVAVASFAFCAIVLPAPALAVMPAKTIAEPHAKSDAEQNLTDRLIVKLRDRRSANMPLSAMTVRGLSAGVGIALTHIRPMSGDAHVMGLSKKIPVEQAWALAQQLMKNPEVEYAEPDRLMQVQQTPSIADPNDVSYPSQWHYHSPAVSAGGANIRAAWNTTTGSAGLTIAVIDTGLRPHEDIAGNILDGSGRVAPGYDFISDPTTANDGDGRDADPTDPGDGGCGGNSSWHGTHVAGTIGALSNNGVGVTGINWVSKVLPVRVLGKCGGTTSDIADAMRWAAGLPIVGVPNNANPARVMNLSLGGSGSCGFTFQSAIDAVVAANAVVVVAAGNSNGDASGATPANCNGVIAVAATGPTGARAYYSNYGSIVKIAAPGGDTSNGISGGVLSTLNAGTTTPGADSYGYYQGTSMATPHVVGIVSLMLSVNPTLTPAEILSIVQATARAFPTGTVRDCTTSLCGAGIIDAAAAVAASDPAFPGILQFTASSSIVSETAGAAIVSVARVGGSHGVVSVGYSTANGTASAGADFTGSVGILTWADGDSAVKTISVSVASDGIAEGNETFSVNLGSPSGAQLGAVSSHTVTIVDPDVFPPSGAFPSGWMTSAGANAGWAVASDSASEGTFSLKSEPIGNSQKAQVEVTKMFSAGQISFARRVSSEPGYDFLRFFIDGVQQGAWSGETAWGNVSFPLTEGNHTLRWSYEKDSSVAYGNDAVWIDAVSLPAEMIGPGLLQFTASSVNVNEATGAVTVWVGRSGGSTGTVSVSYFTSNGTASAGADYTASAGTLTWVDGEFGIKSITIPVANDGIAEGNETFGVNLGSPIGAALGAISSILVTIIDPDGFTPNGTFPAGWTTSAGANSGWSVASDFAYEGVFSLKSDPIGHGQKAQVEITKVFQTGQVNFARRVSSEVNYDFLRFYIDGVQQGAWSGENGWSIASFSLSAGTHTLRWSYEKDPACCVAGSDAAWIDAVSLPPGSAAPGLLQFTASAMNVNETVGTATVSVARLAGSSGSASVSYSTINGTASAGADFTASAGILTWVDGDSAIKTISIPIANDGIVEGNETFSVSLASPSGATLGSVSSIVVTIVDPDVFPAGGNFPSGWTTSVGANAGWSVASDSASEGAFSLKSNQIRDGQNARVEITRTFPVGQVSFTRRVSSESGYDFLRFYIDGVLQGGWSGETGWNSVSYPLSAGSHTLRWSYEKDAGCCIGGSDAAWIDAVSMPAIVIVTPPGAPAISAISPGPGRLTVSFTAPTNNGGGAITGYTTSCSALGQATRSTSGSGSPVVVSGLTPAVSYSCAVTATNGAGTGAASASLMAAPMERVIDLTPILMLLLD